MAELADALDLGSSGQPCGFDSHYPYQRKLTSCQKRRLVVFVNHSRNNKFGGVKMLDTIGAFGSGIGTNLLSDSLSKKLEAFKDKKAIASFTQSLRDWEI